MNARPLLTADAAGIEADVQPKPRWQPSHIFETDLSQQVRVFDTALSTAADLWFLLASPAAPAAQIAFYPICARLILNCNDDPNFNTLFETDAIYSLHDPGGSSFTWDHATLSATGRQFPGTGVVNRFKDVSASMSGFPARPGLATELTQLANGLVGFSIQIDTYDATAAANTYARLDVRVLGFPRPAVRSAGFYTPRLNFKTN